MLGFSAISETAISALPDDLSSFFAISVQGAAEVTVTLLSPLASLIADTDARLIYAAEITVRTLI